MRKCVETIPHFFIVYQYVIDISSELYGHQLFHCQSACALDELAGPVLCEFTETSITLPLSTPEPSGCSFHSAS